MHQYPLLTYDMWHFGYSKDKDSDFGEDDSSGVRMQPDHFPNVARPGGGYNKDTIVKSDKPPVFCNKCDDEMVDGSCLRCDWGEKNRAVPTPNYPLDPFADDKAGIRAGSWKFANEEDNKKYDLTNKKDQKEILAIGAQLDRGNSKFEYVEWFKAIIDASSNYQSKHRIYFDQIINLAKYIRENEDAFINLILNQFATGSLKLVLDNSKNPLADPITIPKIELRNLLIKEGFFKNIHFSISNSFNIVVFNILLDMNQQKIINVIKHRISQIEDPEVKKQVKKSIALVAYNDNVLTHKNKLIECIRKYIEENFEDFTKTVEQYGLSKAMGGSEKSILNKLQNDFDLWIPNKLYRTILGTTLNPIIWYEILPQLKFNTTDLNLPGFKVEYLFDSDQIENIKTVVSNIISNDRQENEDMILSKFDELGIKFEIKKDDQGRIIFPKKYRSMSFLIDPNSGLAVSNISTPDIMNAIANQVKMKDWQKNTILEATSTKRHSFRKIFIDQYLTKYEVKIKGSEEIIRNNQYFGIPGFKDDVFKLTMESFKNGFRKYSNPEIATILNQKYFGGESEINETSVVQIIIRGVGDNKRPPAKTGFSTSNTGFFYVFEILNDVKIGVTNTPFGRYVDYLQNNKLKIPALKESSENLSVSSDVDIASGEIIFPDLGFVEKSKPRQTPALKRVNSSSSLEDLSELEANAIEVDKSWCSGPVSSGGNDPGRLIQNIENLWKSLFVQKGYGISNKNEFFTEKGQSSGKTETISPNPKTISGGNPAPEALNFDLIVFLTEKIIEGGGFIDINDEEIKELIWYHFGGAAEDLFDVFGSYQQDENGNFVIGTSPLGQACGLNFSVNEKTGELNAGISVGIPEDLRSETKELKGVRPQQITSPSENFVIPKQIPIDFESKELLGTTAPPTPDQQIAIMKMLSEGSPQDIYNFDKYRRHWLMGNANNYGQQFAAAVQNQTAIVAEDGSITSPDGNQVYANAAWTNFWNENKVINLAELIQQQTQLNNPEQPVQPDPTPPQNPDQPMQSESSWDFKTANEWDGFDDQAAGDLEGWSTQETKDVYDIFHNRSKNAEREELRDLFQFENYQTMPSENGKLSLREFTEFLLKNIVAPYNQFLIGMKANHILSEEKVDWPSLYKVIEQEAIAEEEQFHDELHHLEGHTPQEHRLCPICNKPPEPDNPDAPGDTTIPPEWSGF